MQLWSIVDTGKKNREDVKCNRNGVLEKITWKIKKRKGHKMKYKKYAGNNTWPCRWWTKQLVWYGYVQRIPHNSIPTKILDWNPQGHGRTRKHWGEGTDNEDPERDLDENMWRHQRRLKIRNRKTAQNIIIRLLMIKYFSFIPFKIFDMNVESIKFILGHH